MKSILGDIIEKEFYQTSKLFNQELQIIDDLRNESLTCAKNIKFNINLELVMKLKKYLSLFNVIIKTFPDDSIEFQWSNLTYRSLHFEKLNLIYQLASYYSMLSLKEAENSQAGLKKSGIYFQYTAGCLEQLKLIQGSYHDNEVIFDISFIDASISLMLAQSQEIYYQKAIIDKLKNTVIFKLTIQISDYYEAALEFLLKYENDFNIYCDYFRLKIVYFKTITYTRYATYCNSKGKYGEELSYLNKSIQLIHEIENINYSKFHQILQDIENLKLKLLGRYEMCKNENEMLHLQRVPNFGKLKPLPRAILVKCLLPGDLEESGDNINNEYIFQSLIPLNIVRKIDEYKKRLDEFIMCELINPIEQLNMDTDNFLNNTQVMAQIDQIFTNNSLPVAIIQHHDKIAKYGNIKKIMDLLNELNGLKLNCRLKLDKIWEVLKDQTVEEESLSKFYGYDKWKLGLIENDNVGSVLLKTFKIYENYMNQGEEGDQLIYTQIDELKPFLQIYANKSQLDEYVPDSDISALNPTFCKVVENLKGVLSDIENDKDDRIKFLERVRKKWQAEKMVDDYKRKLNEHRKNLQDSLDGILENILTKEILKFSEEVEFVKHSLERQDELKSKCNAYNIEFINLKDQLKVSNKRLEFVQVLDSTYQGYFEILGNLNQGIEFYGNLSKNLDVKGRQLVDFVGKRAQARHNLQHELDGLID